MVNNNNSKTNQSNKNMNEVSNNLMEKATVWMMKNTSTIFLGTIVFVFVYHFILMLQNTSQDVMDMLGLIVSFLTDTATMLGLYAILIANKEKFFSKVDARNDEIRNSDMTDMTDMQPVNTSLVEEDISDTSNISSTKENLEIIDILPTKKQSVNTDVVEGDLSSPEENSGIIDILPIKKS
ncbi:hypothetical protein [Rummeliibacillus pycnus]|uniref:hypothetical protein n=1 Tax=Rummeliibacillus pycnus TaxID=101070 RepID=UPI003D2CAF2B